MKETKNSEEFSQYHNFLGNVKSMTVMKYVAKKVHVILPSHSSGNGLNDFKEARKARVLCHYRYHEDHFEVLICLMHLLSAF